jgi:hypothetical protein
VKDKDYLPLNLQPDDLQRLREKHLKEKFRKLKEIIVKRKD